MPKILLECELPWPPSVNHTGIRWGRQGPPGVPEHTRKAVLCRRAGRCAATAGTPAARPGWAVRLSFAPDRRTRDIDNLLKGLLDSMCKAGVYLDDSQFDELRLSRGQCAPGGVVRVRVWEIGG